MTYSLPEIRKAVVALVIAVIAGLAYFLHFSPAFEPAAIVVVGLAFAVYATFKAKNHTPDDEAKSIVALVGGIVAMVGVFVTVPDLSPFLKFLAIALPIVLGGAVQIVPNAGAPPAPARR